MVDTVRLNYTIPTSIASDLTNYCESTGRKVSDVVRQLLIEFIEHDRTVATPRPHPAGGRRTDVEIPSRVLACLEEMIDHERHRTKSALITGLLDEFLGERATRESSVSVTLSIPKSLFETIYDRFGPGPLETVVLQALERVAETEKQEKETV